MSRINVMIAAGIFAVAQSTASAGLVDLSTWTAEGQGTWVLQGTNDTVLQTVNGQPTVFFNGQDSQGLALSGSIKVNGTSDDDFIGFVLGYNAGDLGNAAADYILVDWKRANQGAANAGMILSQVTGAVNSTGADLSSDAWTHTGIVNPLATAATLGSTGWAPNTEYLFDIEFTASNIKVWIDGVLQFDLDGTFSDGSFGFYNFSQPNVLYAGITDEVLPPTVPEPGTMALVGMGLAGLAYRVRRRS